MTSQTALVLGLVSACALAQVRSAVAEPKQKPASEAAQAAQAIERALQKHGSDVYRCFEKVLADRLDAAGKVEVAVGIGKAGKVTSAKVQKLDKSAPAALATCIEKSALGWSIEGIEPGASVVLPFVFKKQQSQYLVHAPDVPERALGGSASGKGRSGPQRAAPFTVKVLADETNVKAEKLSLTLLTVGPASRVAMHRHPHSAKILYLVKGHARLLGPTGVAPIKLEDETAIYIPAGYPHVIENMGRQSTAVFLQAFSPPGPERVYRDPKDARGRAEFEVIRDPGKAKAPAGDVKPVVSSAGEVKPVALPGGQGNTKPLIDAIAGHGMQLSLTELTDGATVQSKGDASSTQALYFLSGGGELKVANETLPIDAGSMIYLPHGTAYAIKVAAAEKGEPIQVVSIKVPAVGKPGVAAPAGAPVRK
jgi:quercetin dioxygenase-like cupin family protein